MVFLRLLPVVLSLALLAAHFYRSGAALLLLPLALAALLFVRRKWAALAVQAGLLLATLEWIRTLSVLVSARASAGQPFLRLAVILGIVAAVTAGSVLVFRHPTVRGWFGRAPDQSGPKQ